MEILSQLESKVESLLLKIKALEEENLRLKLEAEQGRVDLEGENRRLVDELERERSAKQEVAGRIDSLLSKLQDASN